MNKDFFDWKDLLRLPYECGNLIESNFGEFEECRAAAITAWKKTVDKYIDAKCRAEKYARLVPERNYPHAVTLGNSVVTKAVKKNSGVRQYLCRT